MGIFNNLLFLLLLAGLTKTSWTTAIKIGNNLLRDIQTQNNDQIVRNGKIPVGGNSKQVDQRISDIIAENVLHFGHNLGLELAALDRHATRSEIFSPLSLMAALSMLTLGAKGRSYQELKQLLGLDSDSEFIQSPNKYHEEFGLLLNDLQHTNVNKGGINKRPNANWRYTELPTAPVRTSNRTKAPVAHIIKIANGLFVRNGYTLNPDYSQVLQAIYATELKELDFQSRNREARDYINAWVKDATFGKIAQIIKDDIDKSTNIILASALYFKAFWETSFFFRATTEDNFYPDGVNNPPIKVQMMPTGGIFPFYDAKEYNCRIIGLPYKGNETTMYVIQPNNSTRQKLRELQHVLDAHKINGMIDNMERKTTVMVFPKMHFTRTMSMKKILQTMNVHDIFVNGESDLSLIGQRSQTNFTEAPTTQAPSVAQNNSLVQYAWEGVATESVPASFESIHCNSSAKKNFTEATTAQALHFAQNNSLAPYAWEGINSVSVPASFESIHRNISALAIQALHFAQNSSSVQYAREGTATENVPISLEPIHRNGSAKQNYKFVDRYGEPALIFSSRFGGSNDTTNLTKNYDLTPTEKSTSTAYTPTLNKLKKREVSQFSSDPVSLALSNLESNRQKADSYRADLYVDDILHNVDFSIDEQGTEAAAATLTYLHRSGTDVVFRGDTPFLIVIRHDPTKLPLFYGIINKPEL